MGEFAVKSKFDKGDKVISSSDIFFAEPGKAALRLVLRYSKTDQAGRSSVISIGREPGSAICPVAALERYLAVRPPCVGPLFIHMDRTPLSRYQFQSVLRKALIACGLPVSQFKTHSFRIGAATTAALCGVHPDEIKRLGRWRSGAFRLYIRPHAFATLH